MRATAASVMRVPSSRSTHLEGRSTGRPRPASVQLAARRAWRVCVVEVDDRQDHVAPIGAVLGVGEQVGDCRSDGTTGARWTAAPGARGALGSRGVIRSRRRVRRARGPTFAAGTSPSRGTPRCRARAACSHQLERRAVDAVVRRQRRRQHQPRLERRAAARPAGRHAGCRACSARSSVGRTR